VSTAGQGIVEAMKERDIQKSKHCGDCVKCSPLAGGHWCKFLHMRVLAEDPACSHPLGFELPEQDPGEAILESDFGGEQWT